MSVGGEKIRARIELPICVTRFSWTVTTNPLLASLLSCSETTEFANDAHELKRDVKLDDIRRYRIVATANETFWETFHSSQVDGNENLMSASNTHSPRHQIRGRKRQLGVHLLEDDNGETEIVAAIYLENWHDTGGWLRIVANVPRLRHKPNYNNGSADDSADKHTRNPSTDRDDVQDVVRHLDAIVILGNAEQWAQGSGDSRTVKSRCVASTSQRGVFFISHRSFM